MKNHGDVIINWQEEVLIIKPIGPFNEEGQKWANTIAKKSVLTKSLKQWSRIEVWADETMGSPDSLRLVCELYNWFNEHGCSFTAVVISNSLQRQVIETYFSKYQIEVFTEFFEALRWIGNQSKYL